MTGYQIRRATPDEVDFLTGLMQRSKASWGYSAEWMAQLVDTIQITAEQIATRDVFVLEEDGQRVGFCHFYYLPDSTYLEDLFIEPTAMGKGYGKILFNYVIKTARAKGFSQLLFESDPNAEAFYLKLGAERIGIRQSPIFEERVLPQMHYRISDEV